MSETIDRIRYWIAFPFMVLATTFLVIAWIIAGGEDW